MLSRTAFSCEAFSPVLPRDQSEISLLITVTEPDFVWHLQSLYRHSEYLVAFKGSIYIKNNHTVMSPIKILFPCMSFINFLTYQIKLPIREERSRKMVIQKEAHGTI